MKVFLVRHASAGKRSQWQGDDRLRPLDEGGVQQAQELVDELRDDAFQRIVSSPYARCVQTVEPLAEARNLPLETDDALAEDAGSEAALALLSNVGTDLVACAHADLVEALLGEKKPKGSITLFEL